MAGDWIKMRHDLVDDPAVITLAEATGCHPDRVVGMLHRLWSWADRHTKNGDAPVTPMWWIDRHIGVTGFAELLISVGWLEKIGAGGEGFRIPKFDSHNSQTAKQRALTAKRMEKMRDATSVTGASPEKRREEKSKGTYIKGGMGGTKTRKRYPPPVELDEENAK